MFVAYKFMVGCNSNIIDSVGKDLCGLAVALRHGRRDSGDSMLRTSRQDLSYIHDVDALDLKQGKRFLNEMLHVGKRLY